MLLLDDAIDEAVVELEKHKGRKDIEKITVTIEQKAERFTHVVSHYVLSHTISSRVDLGSE